MFEARFESLNMLNRRLKEDAGQKNVIIEGLLCSFPCGSLQNSISRRLIKFTEHTRNLKSLQEQSSAAMDEMEKDYLEQLQTIEDENDKLKSSINEGNDLLAQCQRALSLASQKSATLAVIQSSHKFVLYPAC